MPPSISTPIERKYSRGQMCEARTGRSTPLCPRTLSHLSHKCVFRGANCRTACTLGPRLSVSVEERGSIAICEGRLAVTGFRAS